MSKVWDRAEKGAPARQYLIRRGWPAAAVAALPEDAIALDTEHASGHRLVLPLRIDDEIVDVIGLGDEGIPRRRGKRLPILGSIDDVVLHGTTKEPVFVAVRPDDYLLAQCIVAQRSSRLAGHGVVVGVTAVGVVGELLADIKEAVHTFDKDMAPGTVELWPVSPARQWLSSLGLVKGRSWELTWSQFRDELVQALDWARVRISLAEVPVQQLTDPAACWSQWDSAPLVKTPGKWDWRRTKRMPGTRLHGVPMLKALAYRLPLSVAVRATYWRLDRRSGNELETITPACTDFDLGALVATWLEMHGVQTWCDEQDSEWCYWDRRLMSLNEKDFKAKLLQLANLNEETRAGKVVLSQVRAAARYDTFGQKRPNRHVRPWLWSDTEDGVPFTALALGDAQDRVAIARPGRVVIEPNARTLVLRRPPKAIEWRATTAVEWSRLLYDRMGRWLTCEPALRLLEVSWCVLALAGRRLKRFAPVRPILWPTGPAGSAKTCAAELVQAWFYGSRKALTHPTPAFLMSEAERRPVFAIDNAETAMRSPQMVQLLLTAFLGSTRPKMKLKTDADTIEQPIDAWFLLTSIEGGGIHELINRSLFIRHDVHEFGDDEHDEHDPPAELIEVRGALTSGALVVWAEQILPRLMGGEGVELVKAYREPYRLHPLTRQLKTLATLALVADAIAKLDPRWGVGGAAALDRWLAVLGESTGEMLNSVDPIGGGLRVLVDDFNAVDVGPAGPWQPLVETERVPVRPIFAGSDGGLTVHAAWARKRRRHDSTEARWPIVVGFMGTYSALHAALYERTRSRGVGYADRIPTADILTKRLRHTSGWTTLSRLGRDGRGGNWQHGWVLDETGQFSELGEALRRDLEKAPSPGHDPSWSGAAPGPAQTPEADAAPSRRPAAFRRVRSPRPDTNPQTVEVIDEQEAPHTE